MTETLSIVLSQMTQAVGDLAANADAMRSVRARHRDADLILYPEFQLIGNPPEDQLGMAGSDIVHRNIGSCVGQHQPQLQARRGGVDGKGDGHCVSSGIGTVCPSELIRGSATRPNML